MAKKQYYTSKYGTKIDITGLDAKTIERVKQLADAKRGTEAANIAKAAQSKSTGGNNSTTGGTGGTTNTDVASSGSGPGSSGSSDAPASDTIDTTNTTNREDAAAIERAKQILGIGETFGRSLGSEFYGDGSLGRLAEQVSPEERAAYEQIKDFAARAGLRSADVNALIGQQRGILDQAQQLSPLELEALGVARDALPGLDAQGMQAFRSAAREQINNNALGQARALAKSQARNQVFGAAATAQNRLLGQDAVRETRNLERDLLLKNIDIKQAAQNAFTNLVTNTENSRAGRTNAASNSLSNTLLGDESNRNQAQLGANAQLSSTASSIGTRLDDLRKFNINQAAAEKAGRLGSILGGVGAISGQRGLLAGEDFASKQFLESQEVQDRILKIVQDAMRQQQGTL